MGKSKMKTAAGATGRGALLAGATAVEAPIFGAEITLRVLQGTLNTAGLGFLVAGDGVGWAADKVKGVRKYVESKHKAADGRLADWYGAKKQLEEAAPAPQETIAAREQAAEEEVEALKQEAAEEAAEDPAAEADACPTCGRVIKVSGKRLEEHHATCKERFDEALGVAKAKALADPEADPAKIAQEATMKVRRDAGKKHMEGLIVAELTKEAPAPAPAAEIKSTNRGGITGSVTNPVPA
jgi:hypothetical protein